MLTTGRHTASNFADFTFFQDHPPITAPKNISWNAGLSCKSQSLHSHNEEKTLKNRSCYKPMTKILAAAITRLKPSSSFSSASLPTWRWEGCSGAPVAVTVGVSCGDWEGKECLWASHDRPAGNLRCKTLPNRTVQHNHCVSESLYSRRACQSCPTVPAEALPFPHDIHSRELQAC